MSRAPMSTSNFGLLRFSENTPFTQPLTSIKSSEYQNLSKPMSSLVNTKPSHLSQQEKLRSPTMASSLIFGDSSTSRQFSSPTSSNNCSPPLLQSPKLAPSDIFPSLSSMNKDSLSPPVTSNSSISPPTTQPLISQNPNTVNPNFEHIRLQQLYTLALADRMRFLHPLLSSPYAVAANGQGLPHPIPPPSTAVPPPPPPQAMAHLSHLAAAAIAASSGAPSRLSIPPQPPSHHASHPQSDFSPHHLAAYYGKFDPRMFRIPDEPKPQHSYIGLISMAILSHQDSKLVLADIYQYILDNYTYFRHRGPGWRNSIRHNLSLNDCFIKSGRAANGKGHYWAIHPACLDDFKRGDYRRRKAQRKVRRHMGLQVDEEDSPSPPPPPIPSPIGSVLPLGWPTVTPAGVRIPPPMLPPPLHHHINPSGPPPAPIPLPASLFGQTNSLSNNLLLGQQHESSGLPGSNSLESQKRRLSFESNNTIESDRKYIARSFVDVTEDNGRNKERDEIRSSPDLDVSRGQTSSNGGKKRQFDVASLLGHHQKRSKENVVAAAAAAISSALTHRFSEDTIENDFEEKKKLVQNIPYRKNAVQDDMEDVDDDDGNISESSIEEHENFGKLQSLKNYKEGVAAPGIGHKSFFTPIRDAQGVFSNDNRLTTTTDFNETNVNKHSTGSTDLETTSASEEIKSETGVRKLEKTSLSSQQIHSFSSERDIGLSSNSLMQDSPQKCGSEEGCDSNAKELGALRSSLSFMQAASAQSLNNNLHQENNHSSPLSSAVSPQEYLARYYQIMQQHHQQAAAAMNGSASPLTPKQHP